MTKGELKVVIYINKWDMVAVEKALFKEWRSGKID